MTESEFLTINPTNYGTGTCLIFYAQDLNQNESETNNTAYPLYSNPDSYPSSSGYTIHDIIGMSVPFNSINGKTGSDEKSLEVFVNQEISPSSINGVLDKFSVTINGDTRTINSISLDSSKPKTAALNRAFSSASASAMSAPPRWRASTSSTSWWNDSSGKATGVGSSPR